MKRMKMFKKIGVLALTLLFVLSVSYFGYAKDTTLQKETKYSGNVSWKVVQSGTTYTLTINSSKAEGMPSYNSSNYTSRPWNSYASQITTIKIAGKVDSIGAYAFKGMTGVTSVTIPSTITTIGNGAFEGCTGIGTLTIPDSVTSFGSYVVNGCSGLTTITFGKKFNWTSDTLSGANNISTVTYKGTSIASRACYGRTKLTSVTASSATSIGDDAFNGCSSLSFFNDKNNSVKAATVGARAFADCRSLAQVTVAKAVTSIGEGAFQGCTGMTTLTLADGSFSSSKKIPKSAFRGCTSLTLYRRSVSTETGTSYANYKFPKAITKIEDEAFYGCSSLTTVGLSENIEEIGQNIFGNIKLNALLFWCTWLDDAKGNFAAHETLERIQLGKGVVIIPKQMFINCTNLKYVHMEGAVVDEEKDITATSRAKSITSGNLSNLKIVGSGAFYGCTAMRYMAYPKLATSIGKAAYKYWGSTRDELDGGNVKVSQTIHPEQKGNDVFYNGQNVGKDSAQLNNYYSDGIAAVDINVVVNRPKDYLFIVDTTGSMHTKVKNYQSKNVKKFEVTREALLKIIPIIKNENPNNRISIIAFSIADGTTRSSEVIPFDFEENETNDKRWADTTSIVQNKLQIGSGVTGFTNFTNGPTAQDETGGTDYATGCLGGLYEIMEKAKYEVCTMFMSDGYANTRLANIGSYGAILRCMSENVYSVGIQLVKGEKTVDDDNTPDPEDDTSEDVSISVGKVNKTYNDVFIEYVKKDTNKPEIYLQQVSGKANYFNFVSGDDMQDKINKCMVDFAHTSSKLFDKATIKYKIKNEVWAFYRDNSHQWTVNCPYDRKEDLITFNVDEAMYAIDANGNCTGAKFRLYVQLRDKYTSQNPPSTGYLVSDEVGIKPQNVKQTFLGDSNDSYIYDKTAHYAPWKALPDSGKIKAVWTPSNEWTRIPFDVTSKVNIGEDYTLSVSMTAKNCTCHEFCNHTLHYDNVKKLFYKHDVCGEKGAKETCSLPNSQSPGCYCRSGLHDHPGKIVPELKFGAGKADIVGKGVCSGATSIENGTTLNLTFAEYVTSHYGNEWKNGTVNNADQSIVKYHIGKTGTWSPSVTYTITTKKEYADKMLADLQAQYPGQKFIFTSLNQNESLYTFEYTSTCQETYKLDMEKPYFKIGSIVTVKEDGTKWINFKPGTVAITACDNHSGVNNSKTKIWVNDIAQTPVNNSSINFNFNDEGTYKVRVDCEDNVGNTNSLTFYLKIDWTAPMNKYGVDQSCEWDDEKGAYVSNTFETDGYFLTVSDKFPGRTEPQISGVKLARYIIVPKAVYDTDKTKFQNLVKSGGTLKAKSADLKSMKDYKPADLVSEKPFFVMPPSEMGEGVKCLLVYSIDNAGNESFTDVTINDPKCLTDENEKFSFDYLDYFIRQLSKTKYWGKETYGSARKTPVPFLHTDGGANLKLTLDFIKSYDVQWEDSINVPVETQYLPVYSNAINDVTGLGYRVDMRLRNLKGKFDKTDKINVSYEFYTIDGKKVDLYLPGASGPAVKATNTGANSKYFDLSLTYGDQVVAGSDDELLAKFSKKLTGETMTATSADGSTGYLYFNYYLPANAEFYFSGTSTKYTGDVLLVKANITYNDVSYNNTKMAWSLFTGYKNQFYGMARGHKDAGYGQIFWYSTNKTALDDVEGHKHS